MLARSSWSSIYILDSGPLMTKLSLSLLQVSIIDSSIAENKATCSRCCSFSLSLPCSNVQSLCPWLLGRRHSQVSILRHKPQRIVLLTLASVNGNKVALSPRDGPSNKFPELPSATKHVDLPPCPSRPRPPQGGLDIIKRLPCVPLIKPSGWF